MVATVTLSHADTTTVDKLLDSVVSWTDSVDDPALVDRLPVLAQDLPRSLRTFVAVHRARETPLFRVSGWRVEDDELGPTPSHWRQASGASTLRHELLLLLVATLAGDAFSFAAIQDGRLVNHILPIAGQEDTVTAASSRTALTWHTEGAGLDCRADYQAFLCLRNHDRVPTDVAAIAAVSLDEETARVLRQSRFITPTLGPDGQIDVRIPVLFGAATSPYIRIDPVYMRAVDNDDAAGAALTTLTEQLDAALTPFHHEPGDLFFIDNYQLVHGRPAFHARFDGTSRWLMRVKVARDIRRSRPFRHSTAERVVRLYRQQQHP
jgi:hypothetical protein